MESRKLTKADIDKVRDIEGFPIGKDEDIIALSDAPYYTACPNPFIEEFIKENGTSYDEATDDYHREPFTADVSEGKNDPLYNVHTYHTKVPYKAIMNYILHYTNPGEIVLDGFCGTGMTGVAAKACGTIRPIELLQYEDIMGNVMHGNRKAVLIDLSTAASHIANRYNKGFDLEQLQKEGMILLKKLNEECQWMYETNHNSDDDVLLFSELQEKGTINYTVLSIWQNAFQKGNYYKIYTYGETVPY